MHKLSPITALGGTNARREAIGALTITEVPDVALASLALRSGQGAAVTKAAKKLFGVALPGPGGMVASAPWTLFWTAPDQWFVEAPMASHEDIAAHLKSGFGSAASITEQSGGWARFDLEGTSAVDALERLSAANSRHMQAGQATRSSIEHLGCYLLCRAAGQHFSIYGPRSSAQSLHHALCQAAEVLV